MARIRDYRVIVGRTAEEMETQVRVLVEEGWQPSGGMVYAPPLTTGGATVAGRQPAFMQPMILMASD